ncbi:MAG: hypothetical protein MJE68_21670, partial [Proteobacteria bacterium]|nr:hypothetical protein [Pseudomonadota bacterium]
FIVPANLYYQDIREDYFDGFRKHLHPFFKAKDGNILEYDECSPQFLYQKPLYTAKMEKTLSIEAKRLLMYSNKDYEKVKQKLQKLGRSEN